MNKLLIFLLIGVCLVAVASAWEWDWWEDDDWDWSDRRGYCLPRVCRASCGRRGYRSGYCTGRFCRCI